MGILVGGSVCLLANSAVQLIKGSDEFHQGAHVSINARSEDDVEESFILDKVSKSSGSNYSFHKEKPVTYEDPKPVGSVYKRTVAAAEIKGKNRDQFWSDLEVT